MCGTWHAGNARMACSTRPFPYPCPLVQCMTQQIGVCVAYLCVMVLVVGERGGSTWGELTGCLGK